MLAVRSLITKSVRGRRNGFEQMRASCYIPMLIPSGNDCLRNQIIMLPRLGSSLSCQESDSEETVVVPEAAAGALD
jgi:hypothetical protein